MLAAAFGLELRLIDAVVDHSHGCQLPMLLTLKADAPNPLLPARQPPFDPDDGPGSSSSEDSDDDWDSDEDEVEYLAQDQLVPEPVAVSYAHTRTSAHPGRASRQHPSGCWFLSG